MCISRNNLYFCIADVTRHPLLARAHLLSRPQSSSKSLQSLCLLHFATCKELPLSTLLQTISQHTIKPQMMTCYHINFLLAHLVVHQRTLTSNNISLSNIYERKKGGSCYKDKPEFCHYFISYPV